MDNIELRLLRSLIDREVYLDCVDIFKPESFSEDLEGVAETIQEVHAEFSSGVDLDVVNEYMLTKKVSTTSKKLLMTELVSKIEQVEPVEIEVARKFIFNLAKRSLRLEALNALARVIEQNEESHEHVTSMLSTFSEEEQDDGEVVSSKLEDLYDFYSTANRYPFNVPILQKRIGGMSRGNLAIIFGRPEIGKSSFVASLTGEYIKAGIRTEYYANEEPGMKIMLNIRRAVTGETDAHIVAAIKADKDPTEWAKYAEYLTVRQIGAMSIETIQTRALKNKPEVIILDQVDKLSLVKKYDAGHERLRALYQKAREIAKTCDCLVINISQASVDAENKGILPYSMLDGSKTGKAGEADIILGIGKHGALHPEDEDATAQQMFVTVSKNKINGWHGIAPVMFNAHTNQWSSANE
jgi:KaiC/GvpD/RAD55 family RecA-like ATPase